MNKYYFFYLIVIYQASVIPNFFMEKWTFRLVKSVSSLFLYFSTWLEFTVHLQDKYVQ